MARREENKALKRARLEHAALDLFLTHGFAGTSVERIAGGAGVARGTFYLYHRDKAAIFETVIDAFLGPVSSAAEEARDALVRAGTLDATFPVYARLGARLASAVEAFPDAARLALCESRAPGPGGKLVRRRLQAIEAVTEEILDDATRRGLFRAHRTHAVALAIVGAIERLTWAVLSGDPRAHRETLAAEVVLLFRSGLGQSS